MACIILKYSTFSRFIWSKMKQCGMSIELAALWIGKYLPLFTCTSVNHEMLKRMCLSLCGIFFPLGGGGGAEGGN